LSICILLALLGVSLLVLDGLQDKKDPFNARGPLDSGFNAKQRVACGFMVAGVFAGLLHLILIKAATNDPKWPAVKRVFVGWRLAIHSLVCLSFFTALMVIIFQENLKLEDIKSVMGVLAVWGPSWLVHLILLRFYSKKPPATPRFVPPTLEEA
jgi:hypothetical protein